MGFDLSSYETVETRLHRFLEEKPNARVITELLRYEGEFVVVRAEIYDNREDLRPSATGIAEEKRGAGNVNRTSHVENCETSAIGRALANRGYAPKGARPSREEMQKAERYADSDSSQSSRQQTTVSQGDYELPLKAEGLKRAQKKADEKGINWAEFLTKCAEQNAATVAQCDAILNGMAA